MLPSPIKNVEVVAAPPIENSNVAFTTAILFGTISASLPHTTSLSSQSTSSPTTTLSHPTVTANDVCDVAVDGLTAKGPTLSAMTTPHSSDFSTMATATVVTNERRHEAQINRLTTATALSNNANHSKGVAPAPAKKRKYTPRMDRHDQLKEYKEKHGNTLVPVRFGQLGCWVANQRQARKRAELSDEQIELLDEIGFDWGESRGAQTPWMERLKELEAYEEKHGDTLVPAGFGQLGCWVANQRRARRRGELSEERIGLLDEIGFVWNVRTEQWNINYKKIVAFKNKHGHTNVSKEDDRKLYQWCRYQRDKAAIINDEGESLLDSDERALLEEIGFVFYKRKCSKKVSRIEFEFFHILTMAMEDLGLEFFSLDKAYMSLRFRPDGVINVEFALGNIVVFVEVDERGHNTSHQSYKLPKDENRMVTLRDEAMTDGSVKGVVFIRVNTGELKDVYLPQIETVKEVLEGILSDDNETKGCHVHYIDYKEDDDHVQEARKKKYEFNVKTYHTKNFNPKVSRICTNADNENR